MTVLFNVGCGDYKTVSLWRGRRGVRVEGTTDELTGGSRCTGAAAKEGYKARQGAGEETDDKYSPPVST